MILNFLLICFFVVGIECWLPYRPRYKGEQAEQPIEFNENGKQQPAFVPSQQIIDAR